MSRIIMDGVPIEIPVTWTEVSPNAFKADFDTRQLDLVAEFLEILIKLKQVDEDV